MYRIIRSAVTPWKTRYTVHWLSPDGKDCLLAGNNTLEGAIQSGVNQVEDLLESPWETDERRLLFLENMYIAEGDEVIDTELDDYVDGVMSMISSRMKTKKSANASTEIKAATDDFEMDRLVDYAEKRLAEQCRARDKGEYPDDTRWGKRRLAIDIYVSPAPMKDKIVKNFTWSYNEDDFEEDGLTAKEQLDRALDEFFEYDFPAKKKKKSANSSTKINAWSTAEPSAAEYGKAMDSWKQRLKDRYEPFVVKPVYFDRWSTGSTGYRITLDIEGTEDEHGPVGDFYYEEWILDGEYGNYKLYGSFDPGDIKGWSQLKPGTEIGTFKNIDEAMTYLFQNVDYPDAE